MKNFGAKVSEFGSLVEGDRSNRMRIGNESGIACKHAVHVGPDFDGVGIDRGSNKRRCRKNPIRRGRAWW